MAVLPFGYDPSGFNSSLGNPVGGSPSSSSNSGLSSQLAAKFQALQDAIASGSQDKYDIALAGLMGVFNGQPTLAGQTLYGYSGGSTLTGNPTLATQEALGAINGQPTETAREFNLKSGQDLLSTAAGLTGPKDYGDFMAYTAGGQRLGQQLMAGRPQSSAPVGDMNPMDMYALMQKLGMGPGQGGPKAPATGSTVSGGGGSIIDALLGRDGKYAVGGGGSGGGSDNSDPFMSDFPTMANDADIAYAKANQAFDPQSYLDYVKSMGGTPDDAVKAAAPGYDYAALQPLVDWYNGGASSGGTGLQTSNPAGGRYSPAVSVPPEFQALQPLVDWYNSGASSAGTGLQTANPAGGRYSPAVSASPELAALQPLLDWYNHGASSAGTGLQTTNPAGGRYSPAVTLPANSSATGASAPDWFTDYMKTLIGLGPNLNRGAAENLPMLAQLGMANPQGLQELKNPGGNIDPVYWDSLGPVGQQLILSAGSKVFGWDPTEMQRQIDAQRPLGSTFAPGSVATQYAPLAA